MPTTRLTSNVEFGKKVDVMILQGWWHRRLERFPFKFSALVLLAVAVASLFEAIPMFTIRSVVPTIKSIQPYTPLELAGRDIYIAEGCYNCHSQMIRPIFAETKRYGEYSKPGEFIYDHPFQWGSRRIGPDLAREGQNNPNAEWHSRHFADPQQITPGSIMPPYPWLFKKTINFKAIQARVDVMALMGVPYGEAINSAPAMAREQARAVAKQILDAGGRSDLEDKQVVALIAYLQRLGTDLFKPAPDETPDSPSGESQ